MALLDPTSLELSPRRVAPVRHLARRARHTPLAQAGLVTGFWMAGEALVRAGGIPLPGGIVALVAVLALLASGRLSALTVRRGAHWLLADMLLFFVPAVLAVLEHPELLGLLGLKILFVILASTTAVMVVTALTVDLCSRWRARHVDAIR
ncbi:CidA/LrgA family protein [Ancylobacter sp. 6x-1]|uniref:CidA/LrgA family protein n=1 Tax=Ancylobacter crimeensis TaxID=2579147 RepID=A0ABT0DB04_9HYPH|nr:CidA/LrgA family protein [Ancylobacter crimeensis]MCK0197142.1 CidA/LrgA family protein [Ancylobacter crimeensis]